MNYGASQTFTITPNTGYHVADVLVDGVSVGAVTSYTFSNVIANHTISASFALNTFTITATAGSNGSISPSGSTTVNYGASQTFTITPNTGYHVTDVLVDGVSVGAVTSYTFKNVAANHTISATFGVRSIWYVDDNIAVSGDGKAWATAFKTIQLALDSAAGGDEIWVKAPTYKLAATVEVGKAVAIYGGFSGSETQQDQRNWSNYVTKLDGQGETQILIVSDNATIDGFVLSGGNGSLGGAVLNSAGIVTFANCEFTGNNASWGGAIYNLDAKATFSNCAFYGNIASRGGAIYNDNSNTTIDRCTFSGNNAASGGGGAIGNSSSGTLFVVNSILWRDTGGEIDSGYGQVSVTYSDVQGGYTGEGNIAVNPLFEDSTNGMLRLWPSSPCIDRGTTVSDSDKDLGGNARVVDGDGDGAAKVDMGAYEYQRSILDVIPHFYNTVLGRDPEAGAVDAWKNGYFNYALSFNIDVRFIPSEMGRLFFSFD